MAYQGVTICINKGKTVPDAYLELALKENPSTMGVSFYSAKEKSLMFVRDKTTEGNPTCTVAQLQDILKEHVDNSVVLHLADCDGIDEVCMQPFDVLVDAENEPMMQMFLEGDFSSYTQVNATQTDEFFAANKFIIPFIK